MNTFWVPVWKKAPFIRLLLPFVAGILVEWYLKIEFFQLVLSVTGSVAGVIVFRFLPLVIRFRLRWLQGILVNLLLFAFGALITWQKDVRHQQEWYGNICNDSDHIVATITTTIRQKNKFSRANAVIQNVIHSDSVFCTTGSLMIYFEDSCQNIPLKYGDRILINKIPDKIKNNGNPGGFDFATYCALRNVFHSVFLKRNEWILLPGKDGFPLEQFLINARQAVLNILQKNLNGHDDQISIAEALLIGYTEDLDRDLVQAYSNTGVVHIIAISGMHLALIYVMLVWIFNRIPFVKRSKPVKVLMILSCLWLFSLLTGGAASILRSAVMFTCIVVGENFAKKASIFNSLSSSAFILLCYNPYFLWDVGFQLSYSAVLGIVIFQQPLYRLFFIRNKIFAKIWALMSVSLAAQTFTLPVCIYYFHQVPALFLFTNIIVVPLSTWILFVEIFLVSFSWVPVAGALIGKLTWWLVWLMNKIILWFNSLPFALWDRIPASVISTLILYAVIISSGFWLLKKSKAAFFGSLISLSCFLIVTDISKWKRAKQRKIIVYNVAHHQAMDLIDGFSYQFIGDSVLAGTNPPSNFNLKPSRIFFGLNQTANISTASFVNKKIFLFGQKKMLISPVSFYESPQKIDIDYIILSGNAKLDIPQLCSVFNCRQFIADASNSVWKIGKWKKQCEQLHLRFWSVSEQGAFQSDL